MISGLVAAFSLMVMTGSLFGAEQVLFLSAGGELTVYAIDGGSGELEVRQRIELAGAGPMGFSPKRDLLYVTAAGAAPAGEKGKGKGKGKGADPGGAIVTYRIGKDGQLEEVASGKVNLRPGYLKTDAKGGYLAGNHYGPGKITVWKLDGAGLYQGETVQELELEPNAHSTVFSPDGGFVLVPATGPNKVFQLSFDAATGAVSPHDPSHADGPQAEEEARQPRHLIFHPDGVTVYTTLERERPGVGVWKWNAKQGQLKVVQNVVTQPEGREDVVITTADLHLTPDAKYLYISNRDTTDGKATSGSDSIVGFKVDEKSGRLEMIGHSACERVPRSFTVDETGNYVYVAGQGDAKLGAYRIDGATGKLEKIAQYEVGASPSWVETLTVE